MLLLLMLGVFVKERVCCLLCPFVCVLFSLYLFIYVDSASFLGDDWFPVLTSAMSARNRKRRKLLRVLRREGVTGAGLPSHTSFFALFS
jgi:hypothetical protein